MKPPKASRVVASGERDDLMVVGPYDRSGMRCPNFLDGRPGLLDHPCEVACLAYMARSGVSEPADAVSPASRKDVGHVKMLAEPVEAAVDLIMKPRIGRKAEGSLEYALLGACADAAPRRHETDVHGENCVPARSPGSERARIAGGMATGVAQVARVPCFNMRSSVLAAPLARVNHSVNRPVGNGLFGPVTGLASSAGEKAR